MEGDRAGITCPLVSVVIPAYNAAEHLAACLDALAATTYPMHEVIVVDDGSSDATAAVARARGVTVVQLASRCGPAHARNRGARIAQGEIVLFLDSDILVRQDTVAHMVTTLRDNPGAVAVFGSYDDSPAAPDFLSQFRNLLHHFIHQHSHAEAETFWAGCGAIYREVFWHMQGFDALRYREPSIEDIELGLRMRNRGYRIRLDKTIQVKHLKRWEWRSWLKTDIFQRAVPWSQLFLETGSLPQDLNLRITHRVSAASVGLLALAVLLVFFQDLHVFGVSVPGLSFAMALALIVLLLVLNRKVYRFFSRKRGMKFMVFAIPLHFLYYFYSGLAFVACWMLYKTKHSTIGGQ